MIAPDEVFTEVNVPHSCTVKDCGPPVPVLPVPVEVPALPGGGVGEPVPLHAESEKTSTKPSAIRFMPSFFAPSRHQFQSYDLITNDSFFASIQCGGG